jgi:hypothetical protein
MVLCSVLHLQCLIGHIVLHSRCLFKCTVFHSVIAARKVGQRMVVQRFWLLWFRSYYRFMGMFQVWAESGNAHAFLLLGFVKS